jgi:DNA polymerase III delta prime subunit
MNDYTMWSESYQPKSLDECILKGFPKHVEMTLKKIEKSTQIPNILQFGIAGTGKSTIAKVLAERTNFQVIWKNGSMFTKDDIPNLEKQVTASSLFSTRRIVVIDEADGMSQPAQYALRSLIDPRVEASWLLTCNFRKKLIEPIASRFMQIECALPPQSQRDDHLRGIVRRCQQILRAEQIANISDEELRVIANEKYPDIRQTINEVQLRYSFLSDAS